MNISQLTVIVPTRNEAHNIRAFLASLPPAVALVVVDASHDGTADLVTRLRPERTRVIQQQQGRLTEARQIDSQAALTPWLLFTDADITFASDYFIRLFAYRDYDAVYGPKLSRDEFRRYYRWFSAGQHLLQQFGIPAASGSNFLVSRWAFEAAGGFDLRLTCNEDTELGWRIRRSGHRLAFAPDVVVYARDHRRLYRGVTRKTLHSLSRCLLLYFNLIPARWRSRDWGYWSHLSEAGELSRKL